MSPRLSIALVALAPIPQWGCGLKISVFCVLVRHEGADHQWRTAPPGDLLVNFGS